MPNPMRDKAQRGERPQSVLKTLGRLYGYLTGHKTQFYCLLLILLLVIGCELLLPMIVESCINAIGYAEGVYVNFNGLFVNLALMMAVVALNAALGFFQGKLSAKLTLNMTAKLRQDLFDKIMNLPVSALDKKKKGDLMSRVLNDTDMAARTFSETVIAVFSSAVIIAGCSVIMITKCAEIAAISIGTAVVSTVLAAMFSRMVYPAFSAQQASLGSMNAHVEESLKGFRTSKGFGRIPFNNTQMDGLAGDFYKKRMVAYLLENIMAPFMLLAGNLNFLMVVFFGAKYTLSGVITLGAMQAFILYSKQFMEPINSLGENLISVQNSLAGAERIFSILDMKPERESDQEEAEPIAQAPDITFDDVHFGYHRNLPVINGLTLKVHRGEKLALVGRTGVGKTTLVNLLMQFYDSYDGEIRLDEKNIQEYPLNVLRASVTYIAQDPQIIDGTIFENIAYGQPGATEEQVRSAAETVGILPLIASLPQGFDTPIRHGSEKFSQGQLQLLCLARAALRDAKIIIMDEATSAIDVTTESMLQTGMAKVLEGKTSIIIAHRLSSIVDADHIAVLEDGKIQEYGSHQELMARHDRYYSLYENQFLGKEV